jgi:hypothetical protein
MNVTEYLQKQGHKQVKQIVFKGEPFTAQALQRLRDHVLQTLNRATGDSYTHAAILACSSAAICSTAAVISGS